MTLLQDGSVLVAGGEQDNVKLQTAERYDPKTNSWSAAAMMGDGRSRHTATRLADGSVLVAGGRGGTMASMAERYIPDSDIWVDAGTEVETNTVRAATLLSDRTVLISGTRDGTALNAERYDPLTNSWTSAGAMAISRTLQTSTLLTDGTVMIVGGLDVAGNALANTERFDLGFGIAASRRPIVTPASSPLTPLIPWTVTGSQFVGDSEASNGQSNNSATNFPLVQLQRVDNDALVDLPTTDWSATTATAPTTCTLARGPYRETVITNGMASIAVIIRVGACDRIFSDGFELR
ncbi:MAG TPA: kelch repeat-containing protein, partial [Rudaea sp.]|nr:kelch repeat-containing protein [Rudaea sp.]